MYKKPPFLYIKDINTLIFFLIIFLILSSQDLHASEESSSEAEDYYIGKLAIERVNIFDTSKKDEDTPLFRLINRLHFLTKEEVIKRELLFKEGERLDDELLRESERNLRSLGIFKEVSIEKSWRYEEKQDVVVRTHDSWTTSILVGIGGINKMDLTLAGFEEKNLFGYGKYAVMRYNKSEERRYYTLSYSDPRLLGNFLDLEASYSKLSDGRLLTFSLTRPFYALGTEWSAGISISSQELDLPIYREGEKAYELHSKSKSLELFYGHLLSYENNVLSRIKAFYRYEDSSFSPDGTVSPENIPVDRLISAPGIGFQRMVVDYIKTDHINKFENEEDFNLGGDLNLSAGLSLESLGAKIDEGIFNGSYSFGFRRNEKSFGIGSLSVNFRTPGRNIRNGTGSFDIRFFERSLPRQTLVFHLNITKGWNLDKDVQFTLGANSGLRGYHSNQFTGNRKFLFNIEDRVFIIDDFLHIVSIGIAPFFDMGYVWDQKESIDLSDVKANIGIGLRLGFTRSSVGTVTRFDVAYALNDPGKGRNRWVFIISALPPF